jgi:hypothetical protein
LQVSTLPATPSLAGHTPFQTIPPSSCHASLDLKFKSFISN